MNKLILSGVSALALVAVAATPAAAWTFELGTVQNNVASVSNSVSVSSVTGSNAQTSMGAGSSGLLNFNSPVSSGNLMITGASTTNLNVGTTANYSEDCGCEDRISLFSTKNNMATVSNGVGISSSTGGNTQMSGATGGMNLIGWDNEVGSVNEMQTGPSTTNGNVWSLVNASYQQ